VLVVDDEVTIRDMLLEYVQVWDYGAVPAGSGAEALDLARRLMPDLIILDVGMRPMSGLDVLRELKRDAATRHIPVLLHSVSDQPEGLLALGATDFLQKPVSGARLREAILGALDRRPVPVYIVDGDDGRRERFRAALEETGVTVSAVRTLADATAIPRLPPPIILLGPRLAEGDSTPLLGRWGTDSAFHDATVVLLGQWPPECLQDGVGCHTELLRGQRATDAVGRVRALIAARRTAPRGPGDG